MTSNSPSEGITIAYDDAGVVKTIFRLPPTQSPESPSVYAFSLPKAGSVLLDSILRDLSSAVGLTYVSIMGEFFQLGLAERDVPAETSKIFRDRGYCYGGFRSFPQKFEIPNLRTCTAILLVRDPRDMLVSHYFSTRSSHPEPGRSLSTSMKGMPLRERAQGRTVDEYVIELAQFYSIHLRRYMKVLDENPEAFRVFRYEDVIFGKRNWIAGICETFGWSVPETTIRKIADKNDIRPRAERESQHVRQVVPGDYERKLKPETIAKLNLLLENELRYFGYVHSVEFGESAPSR